MTAQHQVKGLFFVITSGFFFGVACVISKILLNGGSTPLLLILSQIFSVHFAWDFLCSFIGAHSFALIKRM